MLTIRRAYRYGPCQCSYGDYMNHPTSVRLEPGQPERIKQLAESTRRSESGLIRWALELGLRQLEAEDRQNQRAEV